MNTERLFIIVGYLILITFAIGNLLSIIRIDVIEERTGFGPEIAGEYSIFASRNFFLAYNAWGIILAGVTAYAFWKKIRGLLYVGILLLLIVMFYPYFTQSPEESKQAKAAKAQQDSIRRLDSTRIADSLATWYESQQDSSQKDSTGNSDPDSLK